MKHLLCFLTALGVVNAAAATIAVVSTVPTGGNVHGPGGAQVALKNSAGEILPPGMRLRVGYFVGYTADLDFVLRSPGGAFSLMAPGTPHEFIPLGEPPVRIGYGEDVSATAVTKVLSGVLRWNIVIPNVNYMGAPGDPYDDNSFTEGRPAPGTRLFLFAYNTADRLANPWDSPGFEYALFSDPRWVIPETGTATLILNPALIDETGEVFWGSIGNSLHTATAIPEPVALHLALAGVALISRRRRIW